MKNTTERCGVLIYNGKPGYLWHERGIPRKESSCPMRVWGPAENEEQRITLCRNCQHYRLEGPEAGGTGVMVVGSPRRGLP